MEHENSQVQVTQEKHENNTKILELKWCGCKIRYRSFPVDHFEAPAGSLLKQDYLYV